MAEHDPLDLLSASIASSQVATLLTAASEPTSSLAQATYITFPQTDNAAINITKDTPTRFSATQGSTTEFYTIAQIWLAWTERETGVREYLDKGREAGGFVGIADRRIVQDYLSGVKDGEGRVFGKGQTEAAAAAGDEELSAAVVKASESTEAGPSKSAAVKRKYEVDVADREFCRKLRSHEVELRDRNSVLRTCNGGKINNFTPFLQTVMAEKIRALRNSMTAGGSKSAQPTSQPAYDPSRGAKKAKSNTPIIVISSSPTALITMWNVKKFLEQGVFEPSEVARQNETAQGNSRAEDVLQVMRKRTGPTGEISSKYYVVDGVDALQKFGTDAWDRVICVLTTGQAWQFKSYKWQEPKILFRHVKGIYFQWSNEASNPAVKDWNVSSMRIDRNKRHTDRQVVADFWRILDQAKKR